MTEGTTTLFSELSDIYQGKNFPDGTPFADASFLCTTALRERGWTTELIWGLLGPAYEVRPNPYLRNGKIMRLWRKGDVLAAEEDERFRNGRRSQRTRVSRRVAELLGMER
jgi:hypothetical protein